MWTVARNRTGDSRINLLSTHTMHQAACDAARAAIPGIRTCRYRPCMDVLKLDQFLHFLFYEIWWGGDRASTRMFWQQLIRAIFYHVLTAIDNKSDILSQQTCRWTHIEFRSCGSWVMLQIVLKPKFFIKRSLYLRKYHALTSKNTNEQTCVRGTYIHTPLQEPLSP